MQRLAQRGGGGSENKEFAMSYDPRAPTTVQIGARADATSFASFHHYSLHRESSCSISSPNHQSQYRSLRVTAHLSKVNGDTRKV